MLKMEKTSINSLSQDGYGVEKVINLKNSTDETSNEKIEDVGTFETRVGEKLMTMIDPQSELFDRVYEKALKIGIGNDRQAVTSEDVINVCQEFSNDYNEFISSDIQFKSGSFHIFKRQTDPPASRIDINPTSNQEE